MNTNTHASRRTVITAAGAAVTGAAFAAGASPATASPETATAFAPSAPHAPPVLPGQEPREVYERVAREIVRYGEDDTSLTPRYEDILTGRGLPRSGRSPRRVLIVGAGPAGLVAAHLLKEAGHDVVVLEANANRVGGRIKTFRTGGHENAEQPFADPKQYAEAGAMRIPDSHPLVTGLMKELRLRRRRFHLVDVDSDGKPVGRTWIRVNGRRVRRSDYAEAPRKINRTFGVPAEYEDKTAATILHEALAPAHRLVDGKEGKALVDGWVQVIKEYGHYSMYRYLTEVAKLDDATIDLVGTVQNLTSRLHLGFLHSFESTTVISPDTDFYELEGGTATLADALYGRVESHVKLNRRAVRIETSEQGVTVHTVSEPGRGDVVRETFDGDEAIITVPFSGLRHVAFDPPLSYDKRRAVTELHYDSATKVLLEFSRRWWEFDEQEWKRELDAIDPKLYDRYRKGTAATDGSLLGAHPSVPKGHISADQRTHYAAHRAVLRDQPEAADVIGGGSTTDNPNRFMYEPSHPVPGSKGGVLLASYSWADDALKWDCFDDDERYPRALAGVQDVYGRRVEVFYTGVGATQSWTRDPYAYGEASVLWAGQHTELFPHVPTAEGRLHFAGCHTSLKPAWIEGALESAVRTALEVHTKTP